MNQPHHLQESERTKERDSDEMVREEKTQAFEIKDEQFFDNVWHLRKEYLIASQALRKRNQDSPKRTPSIVDQEEEEEEVDMKSLVKVSGSRRPGLAHRKTDPLPMREFSRGIDWKCEEKKMQEIEEEIHINDHQTVCQKNEIESESFNVKKSILNEERFLISSYDLAKRRLSLPLSTPPIERSWNEERTSSQDLDDTEHTVSNTSIKSCHRSSLKQVDYSAMERRRRHSAWTRRQFSTNTSFNDEMNKPLRKRRMSELPALSTIATTRRRNVPHTLSIPAGLRRKGSKAGLTSDYQNLNSSCTRAKNEMLATLSMSSWLDKLPSRQYENARRKSFHTGFGVMALKKKEEKRLMVAHEILQTEKNYIKALETLNEVFVEPLKNACVIPEKDMRTMFPKQLHAMKKGHVQFMNELDERLNNWKWQGVLGDIFAKLGNSYHIDFLTLYSEYVSNFPKSIAVINKHSRNSQKFRKLIEKCSNDPRCERLNISAFLLTPIQRLPRYVLLLRQLAKYTDCNHPDSFHIEISLEKMIDIINLLNSSIQNSTIIARNTSPRRSSRRRRKKHMFKTKEIINSELTSPTKSSDDSDLSEASSPSTPCAKDLSPLTLDLLSSDQQSKSSDYGSLTNSEAALEPTSPSPLSGSSSKSNFLKVILRNSSSDSKKSKRKRPLSTTEVEIIRRKDEHLSNGIPKHDELTRSTSRDSFGSVIRQKFGSLRRKQSQRSSDESLSRNLSLERLNECRQTLFKYRRNSPDEDSLREEDNEQTSCSKSENDLLEGKHKNKLTETEPLHSGSSMESCNGSREHLHVPCAHGHSDSDDDSRLKVPDCTRASRLDCDGVESNYAQKHDHKNNCDETKTYLNHKTLTSGENLGHRKLYKRNSFTNAVKHFFVSKTRSSSSSPETVQHSEIPKSINTEQIFNSRTSKEKISTV